MFVTVIIRRLREGKTYDDFREAWYPDKGFGVPVKVINATREDDPAEIASIGFVDVSADELAPSLERVAAAEAVRHDRIAEVIEETVFRGMYEIRDEDDLTHLVSDS